MSLQGAIVEKEPKMNQAMHNEIEGEVDRISTLPTCILLYIMTFMTTKEALQTCILSKRWKDLWKFLPTLIASNKHFQRVEFFKTFVSKVLLHRDDSSALHNIAIKHNGYVHPQFFCKILFYAVLHNVEQFKIDVCIRGRHRRYIWVLHSMLSCHSLKYLDISLHDSQGTIVLPETLDFPELIKCHMKDVAFSSSNNNDYADPFSHSKKLSTLVLDNCSLDDAQTLCVSGDKLADLTIQFSLLQEDLFEIQIFAPNLNSFAYVGPLTSSNISHRLFEHNLDFLEEARIEALCSEYSSEIAETMKTWLKRFSNVKSLTLCASTLKVLSSTSIFPDIEPIHFGNMISLIVKCGPNTPAPDGILKYLLQESPLGEATIIKDMPSYWAANVPSLMI